MALLKEVTKFRSEALHLLFELFTIIFFVSDAYIAAWCKHPVLLAYLFDSRYFAEAFNIFKGSNLITTESSSNALHIALLSRKRSPRLILLLDQIVAHKIIGEFTMGTVYHHAHFPCIDEKHLARILFLAIEEPDANGDRYVVEQLVGHSNNTLYEVSLNEPPADITLTATLGSERTIGKNKSDTACWRKMMHHVLNPRIVGIALWWHTIFPTDIVCQTTGSPVFHIEGRIGHDEVELLGGVLVITETVTPTVAKVCLQTADGKVHVCHLPGVGVELLTIDGDIAQVTLMLLNELGTLHKHTARTTGRVIDAAFKGLKHFYDGTDNAGRGIEFST